MKSIPKILFLLTTVFFVLLSSSQSAFAQENIYKTLQSPFFDPSSGASGCFSEGDLVGSNNTEKGFNFYVVKGLTPVQSAGIIGNFLRESAMEPRKVQGNPPYLSKTIVPGLGYGLAQWTFPSRQKALGDFARTEGRPVYDLNLQLNFAWHEASQGDVIKTLKTIQSVDAATEYWMDAYENPGVEALEERKAFARNVLARYGSNSAPAESDTSTCTSNESGEVTGEFSLPVARRWYNQHPDWFSKPHHDYPAADIPVPTGTAIFSVSAGKIVRAGDLGSCGRGVIVDVGGGVEFAYCHGLDGGSVPGAKTGDQVTAGQRIMNSDNTGNSSGPHLHFQIKINGQLRCPQRLFKGIAEGRVPDIRSLPSSGCTY
jgi:murein DD-endopeptidase MepM/ murein hydrolase activator NlpD